MILFAALNHVSIISFKLCLVVKYYDKFYDKHDDEFYDKRKWNMLISKLF